VHRSRPKKLPYVFPRSCESYRSGYLSATVSRRLFRRLFCEDLHALSAELRGLPGPPRPLHELRPPPPALSEQMPRLLPHEHVRNGGLHVSLSIRYFFRWKRLAFSGAPPATRRAKRARVRTVPNASLAVRSASGTKVVA
jgi:hypothetical protein